MADLLSTADVARRCGVAVRTAQRHAERDELGRVVGGMRVFTAAEADRLALLIVSAKAGRPPKNP